ncbi:MAG TPA: Crp/Fnr family transcriptional regulator [Flavisolibacter sp.]|nr:Crp/Fnr family transcriptional regulator [Flavisolibacter sp.]
MSPDYSHILKNLSKHISLTDEEADYFTSFLTEKQVKRKEVLLQAGQICRSINYVHSGVLRAFHIDPQGNETSIMFAIPDWWVTDIYSFATQNPAVMHIDALRASEIFQLQKIDLEKLFIEIPKFEKFFRIIMQNSYIREQLRSIQNLSLTAEERYLNFIEKYPAFVQHIPQKQIASYIGITPEFLSTIRQKLRKG